MPSIDLGKWLSRFAVYYSYRNEYNIEQQVYLPEFYNFKCTRNILKNHASVIKLLVLEVVLRIPLFHKSCIPFKDKFFMTCMFALLNWINYVGEEIVSQVYYPNAIIMNIFRICCLQQHKYSNSIDPVPHEKFFGFWWRFKLQQVVTAKVLYI